MYCVLVLVTIAWGALAFGAVYPWGYWPVAIVAAILGAWGLAAPAARRGPSARLGAAFALLAAAVLIQLMPLPGGVLSAVSRATDDFLGRYDLAYHFAREGGQRPWHALSIAPARTWLGLALLAAFGTFVLGLAHKLDGRKLRLLAGGVIVLGVVLGLTGIVQRAMWNGKLYGFWTPRSVGFEPFGPFVNRNHFAGWMLMALPVGLGYFVGLIAIPRHRVGRDWHSHVAWLSGPDANRLLLVAIGLLVMSLSLVLTLSRSGIICLAFALLLQATVVLRRETARARRAIVVLFVTVLAAGTIWWVGLDPLAGRFDAPNRDFAMRLGAWRDALSVARRFPLAGTGLNTYGVAMTLYQTFSAGTVHFAEAHNDYLQLLAEGGGLLTGTAAVVVALFADEVRRRFRERLDDPVGYWIRVGAVTGLLAIALQETVDFSLQMPGNATLLAVLSAIAVRTAGGRGSAANGAPAEMRRALMNTETIPCAICGGDDVKIFRRSADGASIVRCRRDGLLFTSPRAPQGRIAESFATWAWEINDSMASRVAALRREAAILRSLKPGGDLLDVGCASGLFFQFFQGPQWRLAGLEPSHQAAAHARERFHADVVCGFLGQRHWPNRTFDVVSIIDAFYYVPEPRAALAEADRLLKPDGILAIELPGYTFRMLRERGPLCWLLSGVWSRIESGRQLYFYSPRTLTTLLGQAGFTVVGVWPQPAPSRRSTLANAVVAAHFAAARVVSWVTGRRLSIAAKEFYVCRKSSLEAAARHRRNCDTISPTATMTSATSSSDSLG